MEKEYQFFTTYTETEAWLKSMKIENYNINKDLIVDVNGHVNLAKKDLDYIPIQFGIVDGTFWCNDNNLKTLKGSPYHITENFYCDTNYLTSLKDSPKMVGQSFFCYNNKLTSLEDLSTKIQYKLYCDSNPIKNFNSLEFEVKGYIFFTPTKDIDYLDNYKDKDGDIKMIFNEFKKIYSLNELNKKLNNDLILSSNVIKKMKV